MEKCEESRGIKKLPIIRGVKNYPPSKNMNYRFGNIIYEVSQSFLYFDYLIRHKVLDEVTKLPVERKLETSTIVLQNSYLCIHLTFILSSAAAFKSLRIILLKMTSSLTIFTGVS